MLKWIRHLLLISLTLVFCISAFWVLSYYWEGQQQEEKFDRLSQLVQEAATMPSPSAETVPETQPVMLPEYALLYEENPHTVGWLQIPGTDIDYPVMQSPGQSDFYLDHDFEGLYSVRGCLYAREECDVFAPSDNVTIYGHTMADGSMFAQLHLYTNGTFWEENSSFRFDTLYEHREYQIFAVFRTSGNSGLGFPYHRMVNTADREEFDAFVAKCKELSLYDTGITPEYGQKLLCLSTCEYTQENGRLVVAAVRLNNR